MSKYGFAVALEQTQWPHFAGVEMVIPEAKSRHPGGEGHTSPGGSTAGLVLALKSICVRSTVETAEHGLNFVDIPTI